ncbi:DUF6707 family protein [Paenibacillus campi]|uniref:DUF6707 family protein n=1 Tax=Paenibacillus campi TaxID=3106031 RepID=UPI002AFE61A6|nr:DUF6707 family protein [Paenibacillus sp. SGZ-1014]
MNETITLQQALASIMEAANALPEQTSGANDVESAPVKITVSEDTAATGADMSAAAKLTLADVVKRLPVRDMRSEQGRLQALTELAWLLYAQGEDTVARQIVEPLSKVPFDENYNRWTWIEHAIVLSAFVAPEQQTEQARQQAITAIQQAVKTGKKDIVQVKKQVHKRFLNGDTLDTTAIQRDMEAGERTDEAARRLILLMRLRKLELLGGSKAYPAERAAQEAAVQIETIRKIAAEVGLFKLSPFA